MFETKKLTLDFKMDQDGAIEGYGAVFGNIDRGSDVIQKGAFAQSLMGAEKVAMLWQHDPSQPVGVWDDVSEDDNGLKVAGRLLTKTTGGRNTYELIKGGAVDGLSIGYRTVDQEKNADGTRLLKTLDLWEVSIVTFPMNSLARIGKSDTEKLTMEMAANMTERELGRWLARDAKLSRSLVETLLRDGFKGITKRDAGCDLQELARAIAFGALKKESLL